MHETGEEQDMQEINTVVAVHDTQPQAEESRSAFHSSGFDMKKHRAERAV